MDSRKLDLVFLWHMHQPDYRDHLTGEFLMPWVYLHAIKDYTDMASHLERHPKIRAVVNFVPVLLDQIDDYAEQFASGTLRDPLLRLLVHPDMDRLSAPERRMLLDACFRCNHLTMLQPFPHYKRLHELYSGLHSQGEVALAYLSGAFYSDLVTWYHLAWIGETERRRRSLVAQLLSKGEGFTLEDRRQLFALIGELIAGLLPRYRTLAESGSVELSATPNTHPLAPLLIDLGCAREAQPDMPLPDVQGYPGGRARVTAHVQAATESHERRFGQPCRGMWPAEGAISTPFLQLLAAGGVGWAASSEAVLANSLRRSGDGVLPPRERFLYRAYRLDAAPDVALFFRDEKLSDLIGFEYARWHGRDAANHFLGELSTIRQQAPPGEMPLACVMLDGENAWEYYPYNGYYFFDDLYSALAGQADIRTLTLSEWLAGNAERCARLPAVVAGSWVYGTLSTWIGHPDKNRAWEMLCAAKQSYDLVLDSGRLSEAERRAAERQLAVCEGSDWFWWFGDYNPQQAVVSFDQLFRRNLTRLYELLKLMPPAHLAEPISRGSATLQMEAGGTMRRAG